MSAPVTAHSSPRTVTSGPGKLSTSCVDLGDHLSIKNRHYKSTHEYNLLITTYASYVQVFNDVQQKHWQFLF